MGAGKRSIRTVGAVAAGAGVLAIVLGLLVLAVCRIGAFSHFDHLFPSRTIKAPAAPTRLGRATVEPVASTCPSARVRRGVAAPNEKPAPGAGTVAPRRRANNHRRHEDHPTGYSGRVSNARQRGGMKKRFTSLPGGIEILGRKTPRNHRGGPNGTQYLLYSGISRGYTSRLAR